MKLAYLSLGFYTILSLVSCRPEPELTTPDSGDADFSNYVVIGDGYMAGYQDGALFKDGQARSTGALLARQFSVVQEAEGSSASAFNQALMPDNSGIGLNSKPWDVVYTGASVMGDRTDCEGVTSIGPVKDLYTSGEETSYLSTTLFSDLKDHSFPFMRLSDYTSTDFHTRNVYYNKVYGASSTTPLDRITASSAQNITFFAAWLGMEDVFQYAREGGYNNSLMSGTDFRNHLDTVISRMTSNGAKGVIATIPNFRHFPAYTLIPANGAELTLNKADSLNDIYVNSGLSHIQFSEGDNYFVMQDANHSSGVRQIKAGEYLTLSIPLDSMKCEFYGILFTAIHDRYVLDSAEVSQLDAAIDDYNSAIRDMAQTYNLAVFESDPFYASLSSGIKWDGVDFDTEFVSGGFYSLDGFHPNQKGHALLTNELIKAINQTYNATVPNINCTDCNGVLFH